MNENSEQQTTAPDPTAEHPEQADNGNREAAKYRRQLRDTEAERDALTARLDALQRSTVEALASKHIEKPSSLWAAGVELSELLDEDGNIDPEKVTAAALDAKDQLGLNGIPNGPVIPSQGNRPETYQPVSKGFAGAFAPPQN